ncbi:MAG: UvrD-helicase domain-containing protein [Bacteroides sp.]|nr:UvrD-helicase domain-containing protein [Bacteroides sp.]
MEELNDGQRAAVLYNEGPSLVIAGAGSGKTRVLTYKIAYLLEQGYDPWNILALTFTNKAAREMKERIARQVGERARYLWMGTFHSIFSRILRIESQAIGFTSNFTIYDSSDSKSLIKSIIKEIQLDDKVYKPGMIQSRISNAKNHLILPDAYAADGSLLRADMDAKIPATRDIYRRYWERCRQSDAMDFDDLLVYTYILLRDFPQIREKYAEQFNYVLVDEYQDTNFAQHSIVLQLTKERQRVCVVGDDAQSIYSFRGANIDNILKFTQTYRGAKLFKLEQNYRSTQTIVCAANSLIAKNSEQIRKEVFSEKAKGDPIGVFNAYSDVEEGDIVANKISQLRHREGYAYSDFAILYRTNAQSRIFEEALRKRTMPYKIYGGLSFYQRKEVKDVISYFRLAVNPHDEEAFKRVLNYPARGIGDTTLNKIVAAANEHNVSLWRVVEEPLAYGLNINKGTHAKLQGFRELIENFIRDAVEKDAYEVGSAIVRQSGIMNEIYQDRTPENLSRQENIEELVNGMHDFCASRREEGNERVMLTDYLSEVSLLTDQDTDKEGDTEKITLMTIHSAKGLEFKNVFVVGLEENLFPSQLSMNSYRELEEERRLFYVAITRAEEHCFLSFAKSRFKYGKMEFSNPSRFLKDIDVRYLSVPQEERVVRSAEESAPRFQPSTRFTPYSTKPEARTERPHAEIPRSTPVSRFTKVSAASPRPSAGVSANGLQAGNVIEHERFGIGEVTKVEGAGDNCKATVKFRNAGEKQLLLKFARFKVIG